MWNRNRFPREFYVPAGATKFADKQSDAVAYVADKPRKDGTVSIHVVAFCGKRQKPDGNYAFSTQVKAQSYVTRFFEARRESLATRARWTAERRARDTKPRALEVGAVLSGSWGYDQTNLEYYQVVELVGDRSVKIRRVAMVDCSKPGYSSMAGHFIAAPDQFVGEEILTRFVTDGTRVKLNDHCYLSPWNGLPHYSSWYA